jgi:predicted PurR-regulated permease PerM
MHPLTVIILLIIGGKVGGFIGMVLAVPIGVVIKIIYEDLNYYLF